MNVLTDPRFAAIFAAASAAAQSSAALNPKVAMVQGTLTAILQAAAAFQAGVAAGEITDADMVSMVSKAEANFDGLKQDVAASA